MDVYDGRNSIEIMADKIERLHAENARMRDALKSVEWIGTPHEWHIYGFDCPLCHAEADTGRHEPGCKIGEALGIGDA